MDQHLITRIVEAALLAANQPLTLAQLHGLFPEEQPAPNGSVELALETLRDACAERGVELVELASGFRYQVKADVHAWVARMWTERKTKYTRATLETLALIAYRQPITRGEIEQVRGVAVSSNIIQALEEREWIRVVGHRDVPGKPALFGTTKVFLDYFGLKRLDELPPLSELKDIGELEPQFQFDNVMDAAPIDAGGIAAPGVEAQADDEDAGDLHGLRDDASTDREAGNLVPEAAGNDDHFSDARETAAQDADAEDADAEGAAAEGAAAEGAAAEDAVPADGITEHTQDDAGDNDADDDLDDPASDGHPDAAPGERADDQNDFPPAHHGLQDDAVETTTVPLDDDAQPSFAEQASSEHETND